MDECHSAELEEQGANVTNEQSLERLSHQGMNNYKFHLSFCFL